MHAIFKQYQDMLAANEIPEGWPNFTLQEIGIACSKKSTYYKWYNPLLELDADPQVHLWFNHKATTLVASQIFGEKKAKDKYTDVDLRTAVQLMRTRQKE